MSYISRAGVEEITGLENLVDDVIHDLEALDFNSKEARDVVRKAIASAVEAREMEIVKGIEKTDARYQSCANDTVNIILDIINPSKG